jgi:dihydrofolate reductase
LPCSADPAPNGGPRRTRSLPIEPAGGAELIGAGSERRGRGAVRRFQRVSFDKQNERVNGPALAERNWRQQMRKLVVDTFVTLDGVMQAPGGSDEDREGGFAHGGWVVPHFDEQGGAHMVELIQRAGALLLGRKTYDIFAAAWPHAPDTDPIAAVYNRIPKYVASRSPRTLKWTNSHQLSEDIAGEVANLKEQDGGEIQVPGSSELMQALMKSDLVDEFHLIVFPAIVGSGKHLFGNGAISRALSLKSIETTANGVVIQVYERTGDLKTGEIGPEFEETYRSNR